MSKGISKETAEDLIHKAFIYIWEHRGQINPKKSLRAYLFKIGYTRMLNHIRDHKKFVDSEPDLASTQNITAEDDLQNKQLVNAIEQAIEKMPKKMVFEMCFIQDFTYREIAETLDVSIKTVENHMGLAFKDLRSALSDLISDK
jgi:RNA polymerase sigma-70 factor (ECF subfamily)